MPMCEHPGGERHCPNHGPAWADRAAAELEAIARLVGWNPSETLAESVADRLNRLRDALTFYADEPQNYRDGAPGEWVTYPGHPGSYTGFEETEFEHDNGQRARDALAGDPPIASVVVCLECNVVLAVDGEVTTVRPLVQCSHPSSKAYGR